MKKILLLSLLLLICTATAQKKDPCMVFLGRAKSDVEEYRSLLWAGIGSLASTDALRMDAAVQLTDYLVCKEKMR